MPFSLRPLLFLLLTATLVVAPGCDAFNDAVNDAIPEVDVPLGNAGNNIPIAPGAAAKTSTVDGEEDLPSGFDVASIILREENITYTAISGKASRAGSGTIFVAILIDEVPTVSTTITITDDVVTNISPAEISVGSYDANSLAAALEGLSTEEAESLLRDNYGDLTKAQIKDIVADAIGSDNFELSVIVNTSADLLGTLDIDEMTIDIEV